MSSPSATPDAPTHHWEELAQRLDHFLAAWATVEGAGGSPPAIKGFLPDEPGPLRRLVLVELIKSDMEQRIKLTEGSDPSTPALKKLETYAAQFPELRETAT